MVKKSGSSIFTGRASKAYGLSGRILDIESQSNHRDARGVRGPAEILRLQKTFEKHHITFLPSGATSPDFNISSCVKCAMMKLENAWSVLPRISLSQIC
jgi:hypothetical protein